MIGQIRLDHGHGPFFPGARSTENGGVWRLVLVSGDLDEDDEFVPTDSVVFSLPLDVHVSGGQAIIEPVCIKSDDLDVGAEWDIMAITFNGKLVRWHRVVEGPAVHTGGDFSFSWDGFGFN